MHPHHSRCPLCPVSRGDGRSELTREARGRLWIHRAAMQHSRGWYSGKLLASGARQAWISTPGQYNLIYKMRRITPAA